MATRTLLLTGATGALGTPLLAELLHRRAFERVIALTRGTPEALVAALLAENPAADLSRLSCVTAELGTPGTFDALAFLPRAIDCVVHAAACTKFRAPSDELARANREGTRQLLAWATSLSHPPRLLHFSTTCVAGVRCGEIAEEPLPEDHGFVNDYERTKWQAEQLVSSSPLRPEIIRLATVIGDSRDGHLRRPGAFHTALRWLNAGLLPLVPGDAGTRLDLLPTDLVTEFVTRLLARPAQPGAIFHVSTGSRGVPLADMLALTTEKFSARSAAWRARQILPPVLSSRATFEEFRSTITKTRDLLFNRVLESVDSFLPELFYPKMFGTARAEAVWGGALPLPDWRDWLARVVDYALESDFARNEAAVFLRP